MTSTVTFLDVVQTFVESAKDIDDEKSRDKLASARAWVENAGKIAEKENILPGQAILQMFGEKWLTEYAIDQLAELVDKDWIKDDKTKERLQLLGQAALRTFLLTTFGSESQDADAGAVGQGPLADQALAAAALLGADGQEVVRRVPGLTSAPAELASAWADWLGGALAEPGKQQPDELVVAQIGADFALAKDCLTGLTPAEAGHAMRLLARNLDNEVARQLAADALYLDLNQMAGAAADAAVKVRPELAGLLASALTSSAGGGQCRPGHYRRTARKQRDPG